MSEHHNHINYSATDIEKYWKGELSAAQMHAMEKAAQEDPFLADAMDGYEEKTLHSGQPVLHDINDLRERLVERVAERKAEPIQTFQWWRVAAVVLVLIGGVWLYTSITNNNTSQNIAATDAKQQKAESINTDSLQLPLATTNIDTLKDVAVKEKNRAAGVGNAHEAFKPKQNKIDSASKAMVVSPAPFTVHRALKTVPADKATTAAETEKKDVFAKAEEPEAKNQKSGVDADDNKALAAKPAFNTFNGTVVDQTKQPVVNAIVQIPNLNIATQTDSKGNFSFKAPDTALSVSVASVGFETQNLKLQNSAGLSNQIMLKPAMNNLDEVVVTGYGAKKKRSVTKTKDLTIHILDAEPNISWDEYNKYLEKNKKIPEDAKDIHGDIIVSFTVYDKSELKNFNIAKSLQDQLDKEAIRLIKEGPSWRLLKGKKAKVSVMVKF